MVEKKDDCIFCKIISGDIKSEFIYTDDEIVAFADIDPQAPVHVLIVPKMHIENLNKANNDILGKCLGVAVKLAGKQGISDQGYRTVINCNKFGGQAVSHLHIHLLGGRQKLWPPG